LQIIKPITEEDVFLSLEGVYFIIFWCYEKSSNSK